MNININHPYDWEILFYQENDIPYWESYDQEEKPLGKIYQNDNGSYIEATVTCMPAQFWRFKIYCSENNKTTHISTGSGGLTDYFETMKSIADGMIVIKSVTEL